MSLTVYGRGVGSIEDQTVPLSGSPSIIDFRGAGVLASLDPANPQRAIVTVSGGGGGGGGDVVGPAGATDNALARYDGATGLLIQNSVAILTDAGGLSGLTTIGMSGNLTVGGTVDGRDVAADGAVLDARIPSVGEKAALAGTSGAPGVGNEYVTNGDARMTNERTPSAHAASHQNGGGDEIATAVAAANVIPKAGAGGTLAIGFIPLGSTGSTACVGNDARLSDARTPTAHAASHKGGGSDAIADATGSLAGLLPSALFTKLTNLAYTRRDLGAVEFDDPNSSDWTVNAFAALAAGSINAGLLVRRFDDTIQEGVGFDLYIPAGTTSLVFRFISRAQTAPGGAVGVVPKLYHRTIVDNAAVGSWSAGVNMDTIAIPASTNYQYDSQTMTLSGLSLTEATRVQFELTRIGSDGSDTLTGDWTLLSLHVECI